MLHLPIQKWSKQTQNSVSGAVCPELAHLPAGSDVNTCCSQSWMDQCHRPAHQENLVLLDLTASNCVTQQHPVVWLKWKTLPPDSHAEDSSPELEQASAGFILLTQSCNIPLNRFHLCTVTEPEPTNPEAVSVKGPTSGGGTSFRLFGVFSMWSWTYRSYLDRFKNDFILSSKPKFKSRKSFQKEKVTI